MIFSTMTAPVAPEQKEFLIVFNHLTVENYGAFDVQLFSNKIPVAIIQPNTSKTFLDVRPFKSKEGENPYTQSPLGLNKIFIQSMGAGSCLIHIYNYGVKF